ncbi:hypothetical protein CK203_047812 [Vitis vinifera]|uniref:DUF4283 domain-containing protein n=1 Tax=Vitis vinifera TaxID=29760 RepID=A0A438H8F2_VITVI|nr:hypothetical protein CK203_047812 [Vitis vinifera]
MGVKVVREDVIADDFMEDVALGSINGGRSLERSCGPGEEEAVLWWIPNLSRFWLRSWEEKTCCRESNNRGWAIGWEEGNKKYKLERRLNEAGDSSSAQCATLNKKVLSGSQRTRGLETREKGGSKVQWREKGVELKSYVDAVKISPRRVGQSVWLEVGEREVRERIDQLRQCLVGRDFLLFEFESSREAERVLARGVRNIKENVIVLNRWNPEVGCLCKDSSAKEVWVVSAGSLSGEGGSRGGEEDGGSQREKVEQWRVQQGRLDVSSNGVVPPSPPVVISDAGTAVEGRVGSADGRVKGDKQSAWEVPSASRPRAQAISLARGAIGDVDPFVGMSRAPKPLEVSEVVRGEMTDEALRVKASRTKRRREQNIKKEILGSTKFDRGLLVGRSVLGQESLGVSRHGGGTLLNFVPFQNCEDGFLWTFTGVYGPTLKHFPESIVKKAESLDHEKISEVGSFSNFGGVGESLQWGIPVFSSKTGGLIHFPILLDGGGVRRGPTPFQFENMWLKRTGLRIC